ncbi:binding partner of ACD11 1-like [Wolffia australiana]
MDQGGYTIRVSNLSSHATERDLRNFFSFSGEISQIRFASFDEDDDSVAYVTFREARGVETACLLTGSTIAEQVVYIEPWGNSEELQRTRADGLSVTPGQAMTMTQEVVKTMIAMGYVLSKDALGRARAFDEACGLSAAATAKMADLSRRIGITDKIDAIRAVDAQYHLSETAAAVAGATVRAAASAGGAVVNSRYFAAGALFVSDALHKAADYAADLGHRAGHN